MDDASSELAVMPLDLLREITNGFSEERKIGSGSFGKVYLGVHPYGKKIAVKMLYDMPGVDDEQFQNEFKNLTRLEHQNIVRLVGYCHDIQEVQVHHHGKLILAEKTHRALCLEYMSNGSLEKYLSDECDRYDWQKGYRMIEGICQGLNYLHNEIKPPIYHLDLKPANVLLDENMVPRIADFGMSRLFGDEQTRTTKSSLGTIGYLPPEYITQNLVSSKFDIFSLGVVIIKIMAGRAGYFNSADMSSQEFTTLVQENWTNRLLETSNRRNAYSEQVKICIEIGLSCVQEDRHKRPTIQDIVNRLKETKTKCNYAARKDWLLIFQKKPKALQNGDSSASPSMRHRAALSIQKNFRCRKKRKEFQKIRKNVIKIQARFRAHQERNKYKELLQSVGILEKIMLRWFRKGVGLRGISSRAMPIEQDEEEDIVSVFQKERVETAVSEAVSRVSAIVGCPVARLGYHRMLERHQQAKHGHRK